MSQSKCILLVDDDDTTVLLTKLFLESMSYTNVHSSGNGQEALNFLQQHCQQKEVVEEPSAKCPEVIFLDLNMPVMDGFEFLEAYEQMEDYKTKEISVVVVSSSDNNRDKDRIKQYKVSGYIVKPLTEEKLKPFLDR